MRNGSGAPGRGHPSSPRSRSERHVAHGHPCRSSISPIRATWPSANRIVTPSSRLTSRSTGSLLSSTSPGCLIPRCRPRERKDQSTQAGRARSDAPAELAARLRAVRAPTDRSRTLQPAISRGSERPVDLSFVSNAARPSRTSHRSSMPGCACRTARVPELGQVTAEQLGRLGGEFDTLAGPPVVDHSSESGDVNRTQASLSTGATRPCTCCGPNGPPPSSSTGSTPQRVTTESHRAIDLDPLGRLARAFGRFVGSGEVGVRCGRQSAFRTGTSGLRTRDVAQYPSTAQAVRRDAPRHRYPNSLTGSASQRED
jgi:hypothetical protein